jgi:hypothetical protein
MNGRAVSPRWRRDWSMDRPSDEPEARSTEVGDASPSSGAIRPSIGAEIDQSATDVT